MISFVRKLLICHQMKCERTEPLTAFARELSREGQQIKIPKDFELLGIKGEILTFSADVLEYIQILERLLLFDENNHINFDWYYPKYAWRHT